MADDMFDAYINNVKVLSGDDWEKIFSATVDIASNYNISLCDQTNPQNQLKIIAKNVRGEASIAYTLEEDTACT